MLCHPFHHLRYPLCEYVTGYDCMGHALVHALAFALSCDYSRAYVFLTAQKPSDVDYKAYREISSAARTRRFWKLPSPKACITFGTGRTKWAVAINLSAKV